MTSAPYVVPFGVFMVMLAVRDFLFPPPLVWQILWSGVVGATILALSRPVLDFRVRRWLGTIAVGVLVFVLWIAPDVLFPGYRGHWFFNNSILGAPAGRPPGTGDALALTLRTFRAVVIVPIAEELFWRGWMMRWLIKPDFARVPMGTYSPQAFWIVAVLFASEHGSYWDVGLMAGIVYNWWLLRTRNLGDLILAHAITNACLSAYVMAYGKWEYW